MAAVSIFDIFKIGIGPSSSHTLGPMKAAREFVFRLADSAGQVATIEVTLHGSLAYTGKGHATDSAIVLGLMGLQAETIDPDSIEPILRAVHSDKVLHVPAVGQVIFDPASDLKFDFYNELPRHTNGMRFTARSESQQVLCDEIYYSLGGGFIVRDDEPESTAQKDEPPYRYNSGDSLLAVAAQNGMTVAEIVYANEKHWHDADDIERRIKGLWAAMRACIERGLHSEGVLPGNAAVLRRAGKLNKRLSERGDQSGLDAMEWVNAFAIAVNEENAAGGRVVTSPTNGAAGIVPAVLMYYDRFVPNASDEGIRTFLLTAGAIGILYKLNASISGAEMGCQGEVGVACSMAAAGLAAALGGSNDHVEEAAEIGMEHNLGLTCDPVGGLVQIPCIERNAMGAVKAINAARLAMHGDGTHKVSLDQVIETMRQTGLDMSSRYKETSQGGLAVNVPEC
jgi:L-serine dehydratase